MKPPHLEIHRQSPPGSDYDLVISECPRGVWIVMYQGRPIQVRRDHHYRNEKKYLPNCWSQRGGAQRQADRLNKLFQTTDFEIAEITSKNPR